MQKINVLKNALLLGALCSISAHAGLLANEGFECGASRPPVATGNGQSALCDWYQWANSGPVVKTWLSMTNVARGNSSAHVSGGLNSGLYQYGMFAPGTYTASGWFWVDKGSAKIGLFYDGGSTGGYSPATTTTGQWEYLSQTSNLGSGPSGPVIYGGSAVSNFYVDAFWFNAGVTSNSPFAPSTGSNPHAEQYSEVSPEAVPEPGTMALMGLGLIAFAAGMRRRKA